MNSHTDYEDKELNAFTEKLWNNDDNACFEGTDYELDKQGRTKYSKTGDDKAKDPLFSWVSKSAFERPTYKAFIALLDNYESQTGVEEVVTKEERKENWEFINLVFESTPMKLAYEFLKSKGKASSDEKKFKQEFHDMWFKLYKRDYGVRHGDSSGFEHVFVGETRKDEIIGFHNWIQFYLQEKAGKVDYNGFMSSDKNPNLLTVQFSWDGDVKPKGSMLFGVSPEFEISLYTVCYLLGHDSYLITLGGQPVVIKAYKNHGLIGTTFPQMPPYKKHN